MELFADYIQPLTEWLRAHPNSALFITFIISLSESLAIVGSIVPGSISMTAIGILAGSGVMRIDLTLSAAILGAIAGDSLSYFIGYYYSNALYEMWPFNKYPKLLVYGTQYFHNHGGKSVLIGRFVGPLRSIIPVIAGILKMKQWRFLLANVISAIGWSFLYVIPGVLIGAASNELSPEGATRLIVLILTSLLLFWVGSILLKTILSYAHTFLSDCISRAWGALEHKRGFKKLYSLLTPKAELEHSDTGIMTFSGLLAFLIFIALVLTDETTFVKDINHSIHYFFHTLQTQHLNSVFIVLKQFISYWTLSVVYLICMIFFVVTQKKRNAVYLTLLLFFSLLISYFINQQHTVGSPEDISHFIKAHSFPYVLLLVATSLFTYLALHKGTLNSSLIYVLRAIVLTILGLAGLGALYFGDYWLSDILGAYFGGMFFAILMFLLYRSKAINVIDVTLTNFNISLILIALFGVSLLSACMHYKTLSSRYQSFQSELIVQENQWWNQKNPILPIYRFNRLGSRISLMNIQYQGNIENLATNLESTGWVQQKDTFFSKLIKKVDNKSDTVKLPLFPQLFDNKPPKLIMTYKIKQLDYIIVLSMWESNYNLNTLDNPLWLGSIDITLPNGKAPYVLPLNKINPVTYLLPALNHYNVRRISLATQKIKKTTLPVTPYILLIRAKE